MIESDFCSMIYNLDDQYWIKDEDYHLIREMARQFGIRDHQGEKAYRLEKENLKKGLEAIVADLVTNQEFGTGLLLFPDNPPKSKLDYYIRKIYLGHFGNK